MDRRRELVLAAHRYLLDHGVADLSLRPLAAAVGTSARLLVYHFGSKEGLIAAVMDEVRGELQALLARALADRGARHPLLAFWQAATASRYLPELRLLFEVQVLALQNPGRYARYLADTSASWLQLIESALPAGRGAAALATLYTAVVDGLLLELLASRDLKRTSAALERFVSMLPAVQGSARRKRARRS